ncbi:MAG: CotH kinase family protein [Nannocystaceae bacterium]
MFSYIMHAVTSSFASALALTFVTVLLACAAAPPGEDVATSPAVGGPGAAGSSGSGSSSGEGTSHEGSSATSDDPSDEGETATSSLGPGDTVIDDVEEMYSLAHLPSFHIYLDDEGIEKLSGDDESVLKTYVTGSFRYRDETIDEVGVRLKGNLTLTNLTKKPSFKVKFNKFIKGQKFLGLESITLQNCHTDTSMVREHLAYKIFRESGVPASRTGYAQVYLNDELYGLYVNLETLDDEFLGHNYQDASGNLYEGEHGDDLDHSEWNFEQDEGDDTSRDDLRELSEVALRDDDSLFFGPNPPLETDRVLDHIAAEAYVGHFDGYRASHNYFIYHEPTIDKWTWIPWSLDQTLIRRSSPFSGGGFVDTKCRNLPNCLVYYIGRAERLADGAEALHLEGELERVIALIDEAARNDPRKRHSNASMESGQKRVQSWIEDRPAQFREQLDCLVGGVEPDADGDGFGPCFQDCDDTDPNVNPGRVEVCDGVDNNCSGFVDDIPECPCASREIAGNTFYFCEHTFKWTKARQFCADQGHRLARLDSPEQNEKVWAVARDIRSTKWAIGLNDRVQEETYVWVDGTEPTFTAWADGEPAHALGWFDCVFYGGSMNPTWRERNCVATGPFICSAVAE